MGFGGEKTSKTFESFDDEKLVEPTGDTESEQKDEARGGQKAGH